MQDRRLAWVEAMWIDDDGRSLMPAAQLNRTAVLYRGSTSSSPCTVYACPTVKASSRS